MYLLPQISQQLRLLYTPLKEATLIGEISSILKTDINLIIYTKAVTEKSNLSTALQRKAPWLEVLVQE